MVSDHNKNIYAVIGDQTLETELQNFNNDLISDAGIILRVGIDNKVKSPSLSDSPNDHYYGVGIRNSFGLAIDPFTNNLWITENGTHEYDEINLTFPKYNSGWKKIQGPATDEQLQNFVGYSDYEYSDPEFSWEETPAPTGISFVDDKWKKFSNSVFVGDCSGNLYKFQLNTSRDKLVFDTPELKDLVLNADDSDSEIIFGTNFGCITDVEYNPDDGYLYIISYLNNGAIYKISPNNP
jgi:glucose/arabinose dehydrogenase